MLALNKKQLRLHLMQQRKTLEYLAFKEDFTTLSALHQQLADICVHLLTEKAQLMHAKNQQCYVFNIASYHALDAEIHISVEKALLILKNYLGNHLDPFANQFLDAVIEINIFLPYAFKNGHLAFHLYQNFVLNFSNLNLSNLNFSNLMDAQSDLLELDDPKNIQNPQNPQNHFFQKKYPAYQEKWVEDEYQIKSILSRSIAPCDLDLVIIPSVGIYEYQNALHRIGYGAGFYDRCFAFINNDKLNLNTKFKKKIYMVGINHDWQKKIYTLSDAAKHQAYDLVLDAVL